MKLARSCWHMVYVAQCEAYGAYVRELEEIGGQALCLDIYLDMWSGCVCRCVVDLRNLEEVSWQL